MVKNIKRSLRMLLVIVMLASMFCITAFAAAPAYAHLEAGQATYTDLTVGSEVRIPVSLAGMASGDYLAGFYCHLDNTDYLTVKSVEFTAEIAPWSGGYNSTSQDINKVQLSAAETPSTAKRDNGLLFTIVYTVAKEIPAGTQVNPSITGVMLNKTSKIFLNSANGERPTADEMAASIVYPEKGCIYVPTPASFTVTVEATPASVVLGDTVTVTVKVTGGTFSGASYSLTYETDKFELVSKDSSAKDVGTNGFKAWYLDSSSTGSASGTVIGTYTFKALAQDTDNVTGYFTLGGEAGIGTFETAAAGGNEIPAAISAPAAVTIGLSDALTVSAQDVEKDYDGNAYGVSAAANKTGAEIRYKDASGNYTLTTSPTYSAVGTYTVEFKASLKGYRDAYGSADVTINAPKFETETTEYVAGYSLILVYTNQDGMAFTYDGHAMCDVTTAGYVKDGKSFKHVYGVVVKGTADMTKLAFTAGASAQVGYSNDVNGSNKTDLQDVVATVGVYNARAEFMNDGKMMIVLRADVNHDKQVTSADTTQVLEAIKN